TTTTITTGGGSPSSLITSLAASGSTFVAVKNGVPYLWGTPRFGVSCPYAFNSMTISACVTAVPIPGLSHLSTLKLGRNYYCAIDDKGAVLCGGSADHGVLGP